MNTRILPSTHVTSVGVIGLGYVGLPLALLFVKKGVTVTGIDIDRARIEQLEQHLSYLPDIPDSEITAAFKTGRFQVTSDYEKATDLDSLVICVPTPLTEYRNPDLSYLQSAGQALLPYFRKGQLLILESSTYPGTTNEVMLPLVESSGLVVGEDIFLGYSPERVDPGNKNFDLLQIPKVVSGVTDSCRERISDFYGSIFDRVVPVSTTQVAELTKLLENTYRFVNISLINELAYLCDVLKIDIWEAIEAAKTKPFGFQAFYPGPGVGGHCIPVDPLYLQWKSKQHSVSSNIIQSCDQLNQQIPAKIVLTLKELLSDNQDIVGARVLVYGVAYKKDVNDVRESKALELIHLLQSFKAVVSYHDPLIPQIRVSDHSLQSQPLSAETLAAVDATVILVDHSTIPVQQILDYSPLVIDCRNVTKGFTGNARVRRLGGGGT